MVEISVLKRPRTEATATQRKFFKKSAKGKVIKGVLLAFQRLPYQHLSSFTGAIPPRRCFMWHKWLPRLSGGSTSRAWGKESFLVPQWPFPTSRYECFLVAGEDPIQRSEEISAYV